MHALNNPPTNLFPPVEEKNFCPAVIHLQIKNLANTGYECTLCHKPVSCYYSDSYDLVRNINISSTLNNRPSPAISNLEHNMLMNTLMGHHRSDTGPTSNYSRTICKFCKKNGETPMVYRSHWLKDYQGKVLCPILRRYKCKLCNATGDNAHTKKYCPKYVPETRGEMS